ncbi:MAG: NAD(P)-dependent oxidoreductase [Clostridia bacterium]|nr:NAD(P)-dependent oxidoreductase [Clostridia bacterium]
MSKRYPVMLDISGRVCTVIGGGKVALRKAAGLAAAGGCVRVAAPEISEGMPKGTELIRCRYSKELIKGSFIVFAATNDKKLNEKIVEDARSLGILAMSVCGGGDFTNGAVRSEGGVDIQICSGVPALSAELCARLNIDGAANAAEILKKYRKCLGRGEYARLCSEEMLMLAAENPSEYENEVVKIVNIS